MENYRSLYEEAAKLGVCAMLTGSEDAPRLMRLMLTPQGIEFCTKNNFPSLCRMREFRGEMAQQHGIYIDTDVELTNHPKLVLVGNTHAVLHYDDTTKRHQVVLMHGATALITASDWAVVFITGQGATCRATNNALIL